MNKKPRTFRQTMTRALITPFVIVGMFAVGYFAVSAMPATMVMPEQETTGPIVPASEPSKAERLSERFDCWNGEAPADMVGVIPGHVIVTEAGRTFRAGPAKVGTALAHIFEGEPTEIETIHAFCR